MAPIEDHVYMKCCAELASCLSISIASARRKVELAAAKNGVKDSAARTVIAKRLLEEARSLDIGGNESGAAQLDDLLKILAEEENFMVED